MGMTPWQRKRLSEYLKRIQAQREKLKEMEINRNKPLNWFQKLGLLGFAFFLLKGLFWLLLIYLGVGIL